MEFEPNRGQARGDAEFLARGRGYLLEIGATHARMSLGGDATAPTAALDMMLIGAAARPALRAEAPQPGRSHYLLGADTAGHLRDVPHFGRVVAAQVYPGIDLVYYGKQTLLEYDFIVAPGADPGRIQLSFSGHESVALSPEGDLVFRWGARELRQKRPVLYQEPGRVPVEGRFRLASNGQVGFDVPTWDREKTLVIDPTLVFSTYLGGATGNDTAQGVAVDASGNIYIGGTTTSNPFPTQGPYDGTYGGMNDAFITKINAAGTAIVYSTYLGGTAADEGRAIAVDSAGSAYLAGTTGSGNTFPSTTPLSAFCSSGFVTKLTPAGNALSYSFCFGANIAAVAVDPSANVYVTGTTYGSLGPVNAAQATLGGGADVFAGKLNAFATAWVYLTYLGGTGFEDGYGIASDPGGNACVTGRTSSTNFPIANARQAALAGGSADDAFVTRYNATGAVVFSTYLGGSGYDVGNGVAMDAAGNCYVTGNAGSTNFPLANAVQATNQGGYDAFVTAYNASGSAYLYSTYLGGLFGESAKAIAVSSAGIAHVVGDTVSANFPAQNPLVPAMIDLGAVHTSSTSGATFALTGLTGVSVQALAVDPTNAQTIFAGTSNGIYRTGNGGTSWTRVDSGLSHTYVTSLAILPTTPCTVYAGINSFLTTINLGNGQVLIQNTSGILVRSTDCGVSWGAAGVSGRDATAVAVTSGSLPAVYFGVATNTASFPNYSVARSAPSGYEFAPGYVASEIATDPANPCTVYMGDFSGAVRKNTSCTTWNWATVGATLSGGVTGLAVHPSNEQTILAGTQTGNIYRKIDAANPWVLVGTIPGSVSAVTYHPGNPQIAYLAGSGGVVYKSLNGGVSWQASFTIGPSISSLAVAAQAQNALFAGTVSQNDLFYVRLSAAGALLDSTWFGGHGSEFAQAVAVHPSGDAVVVGNTTNTADLPVTAGAITRALPGNGDSFVARLSSSSASCNVALAPTSANVSAGGGVGSVTVLAPLGCAWTATSNAAFITVTAGTSGIGGGTVTYSLTANTGAGQRVGTITIAGQTFTVMQPVSPTITLSTTALNFAGTNANGTLSPITAPQRVIVSVGGSNPNWTAASNQPWAQVTGGTGASGGNFTVGIVNPGNVIGASTELSASITVTAPGATNSPVTLPVTLRLGPATQFSGPVGIFDTPAHGATGLQGSIAVTGWAVDDVEIDRVEIWRDPVAGETPYYGPGPGNGKVFIAVPLFVSGSRPDIEAAYPNYPFAYRAGWGYLLLTWGLANQGNGTYTLYAFAFDKDGHSATLGTKAIGVSNAQATKPFGGIDVPSYGGTVSGAFWNYGWALTPNANTTDLRNCTITNGNVSVSIDSGPLVPVTYGGARPDIATSFPGFSNGSAGGGAHYLDPSTLANGTHTIGWLVYDSCGRGDGIGSRFFTVTGSADAGVSDSAPADAPAPAEGAGVPSDPTADAPLARGGASATGVGVRRRLGEIAAAPAPANGVYVVDVAQDERVEVHLPSAAGVRYTGHQIVGGESRGLPAGSSLDPRAGIFYWQPAPGFLGAYDLAFTATDTTVKRVRVVVGPSLRMVIDTPTAGVVEGAFAVSGWALDLASAGGSGIDAVHVWAHPIDGSDPIFVGHAALGGHRPDVAAIYGPAFAQVAYDLDVDRLASGTYDLVVYTRRASTGAFEGAQAVRVIVR